MASPTVAGVAETSVATATATPVVNMGSPTAGQLLIAVVAVTSMSTWTDAQGFTELDSGSAADVDAWLAWKVATGSEGTTDTFTNVSSSKSAWLVYRIDGAADPASVALQRAITNLAATTTPNPPSVSLSASRDYLFITGVSQAGEEADDDTWANTPPTNYTPSPPRQVTSGVGGAATTNCSVCSAERALTTSGSEDPGTFSVDQSLTSWAWTIAVSPAVATFSPPPPIGKKLLHVQHAERDSWNTTRGWSR